MEIDLGLGAESLFPVGGAGGRHVHGPQDLRRHRTREQLLRCGGIIALRAVHAGLVLHLHHDHGALRVRPLEVGHERGECLGIGRQRGGGERRRRVDRMAVLIDHMRVGMRGPLHPLRHVVLVAVLPRPEPQQYQVQLVLSRLREQRVDGAVIVCALFRLELFPVHRDFHGVGMHILDGGPDFGQNLRPAAGIIDFRTEHQKGDVVDHQCIAAILPDQAGNWRVLDGRGCRSHRRPDHRGGRQARGRAQNPSHRHTPSDGATCGLRIKYAAGPQTLIPIAAGRRPSVRRSFRRRRETCRTRSWCTSWRHPWDPAPRARRQEPPDRLAPRWPPPRA